MSVYGTDPDSPHVKRVKKTVTKEYGTIALIKT